MFEITPLLIQKEEIHSLVFPNQPIEHTAERLNYLEKAILKALKIGNAYRRKIKIIFYDASGLKQVETTVWNSKHRDIILKNGVIIPFHRLVDIKYV